jgi:hypothetical protein
MKTEAEESLQDEQPQVYREFCITEACREEDRKAAAGIWIYDHLKRLKIVEGPPVLLPVGSLAELSFDTAHQDFLLGRCRPFEPAIPARAIYKMIKFHRSVVDGKFLDLHPDELVELTDEEALPLLRSQKAILTELPLSKEEK